MLFDRLLPDGSGAGPTTRRVFLAISGCALAGIAISRLFPRTAAGHSSGHASGRAASAQPATVTVMEFSDGGKPLGLASVAKVVKTDEEWRKQLSRGVYEITRHADTEFAFSGEYWNFDDKGIYRCVCCATALFSSDAKFDSGTGWPSFWAPIAKENVETTEDSCFGIARTAVACRQCDAHLGHVFDDGPPPTGLRYCINSASLRFVKLA